MINTVDTCGGQETIHFNKSIQISLQREEMTGRVKNIFWVICIKNKLFSDEYMWEYVDIFYYEKNKFITKFK